MSFLEDLGVTPLPLLVDHEEVVPLPLPIPMPLPEPLPERDLRDPVAEDQGQPQENLFQIPSPFDIRVLNTKRVSGPDNNGRN